jgi:hypothetical protein
LLRREIWYKFIALMMEAASTSETINFYQITRLNNPEDNHLQMLDLLAKQVPETSFVGREPSCGTLMELSGGL